MNAPSRPGLLVRYRAHEEALWVALEARERMRGEADRLVEIARESRDLAYLALCLSVPCLSCGAAIGARCTGYPPTGHNRRAPGCLAEHSVAS